MLTHRPKISSRNHGHDGINMTLETCKKMYEHFKNIGDEKNTKIFEERIKRKEAELEIDKEETKSKGKK